ncbi:dihydrodipicolinate synthase family protein [Candidatus Woesearchaeota archaeon]|nr:dihydrodipicolinate synthase family protein [Candidatus Woesearchaeota archaeon]
MNNRIEGDQVLMVTPFDNELNIDYESTKKLIDFLINGGVQGILSSGSTGEFFSMDNGERKQFMSFVVRYVNNRVPAGFCCGHSGTKIASELAGHAERIGASYILLPPPYYFNHDSDGIFNHISKVASSVEIPIMVYDGGGGIEISVDTLKKLKDKHDNIKYVKVSVRSPQKVKKIIETFSGSLIPFCGDESMCLLELSEGVGGFTLGAGNIQPNVTSKIFELYKQGDLMESRKLFYEKLMPQVGICNIAWKEYIQCFKTVLYWKGIINSPIVRSPLLPLDNVREGELKKVMQHLEVI